jgi:hypothetical protein
MNLNLYKWIASGISITCSVMQATAIIDIQWIAWIFLTVSVIMWTYVSYLEGDRPRLAQQIVFIVLSFVAVYNWFQYR